MILIIKDRMIGNTDFQKTVPYVTMRPSNVGRSRHEVKNDVGKYYRQIVVIGLYTVCGHLLDNQVPGPCT